MKKNRSFYIDLIAAISSIGIFVVDLCLPLGVAGGVPYIALVVFSLASERRKLSLILGITGSTLTILGFLFSRVGAELWIVLTNRGFALLGIWAAVFFCSSSKKNERHLHFSNQRLSLALEASEAGVYDHTVPLGPKTFIDKRWANLLGYSLEELPTFDQLLTWFEAKIHPDDLFRSKEEYTRFIAGQKPDCNIEIRLKHKSGAWIHIHNLAKPVEQDEVGRVTRVVGVMSDVTDRTNKAKSAREAERIRVLMETAGAAAHEIFQPLTAILGYAGLLVNRTADDDARGKQIETIRRAAKRIEEIVRKMQDIHQYSTKSYAGETDIVDFDVSSEA